MERSPRTSAPPRPADSPDNSPNDALDACAAMDALAFDTSLSFLADADSSPLTISETVPFLPSATPRSPLLLPESAEEDLNTSALLDALLADETDERGGAPLKEQPPEASGPLSSSRPVTPPMPAPTHKSTASRVRQKEEIEYLRSQVAELESELTRLKQPVEAGTTDEASSVAAMWASIAQRQSAEKQRAEIENMKLRSMLEGQLRVARSLEKLLRKRLVSESDALFVQRKRSRESPSLDLGYAVEDIRARIHNQLDNVDVIVAESGIATIQTDFDGLQVTNDSANGICMERIMVKAYPFPTADVAEAVWQLMSAERIELPNGYYGATNRTESIADVQFSVKLRVRRLDATIHVRGVTARRSNPNHETRYVFESIGTTDGPLFSGQGIRCRELGYTVVEAGPTSGNTPSTIVKVCVRLWPEVDEAGSSSEGGTPDVGLFVDLVVGSYNENVKVMLQAVENMLIGGPLTSHNV